MFAGAEDKLIRAVEFRMAPTRTELKGDHMTKPDPDRLTNKQLAIRMVLLEASTGMRQFVAPVEAKYMAALDAARKVRNQPAHRSSGAKS